MYSESNDLLEGVEINTVVVNDSTGLHIGQKHGPNKREVCSIQAFCMGDEATAEQFVGFDKNGKPVSLLQPGTLDRIQISYNLEVPENEQSPTK